MDKLKRVISASLAAATLASCMTITGFAGNLNNEGTAKKRETASGTAAYATGNIVIDGVRESLYDSAPVMDINHVAENNAGSLFNKNFKGKTWALWDEEFLYLYTEVSDKNIVNTYTGSNMETKLNDRITYYFDFNNTQNETIKYDGSAYVQGMYFDVRVTDDEDYNFYIADGVSKFIYPKYSDDKNSKEYKAYKEFVDTTFDRAVKVTPGVGYSFEVKIKVSNLKFNIMGKTVQQDNKSGAQYGFDVYLHDHHVDQPAGLPGNRVALCTFSKESDNKSWDYPGYLGTLTLGKKPETAAKHGWINEGGYWHYYNHGTMITNSFVDRIGTKVFVKANGNIAKNEIVNYKGERYYIDAEGAALKSASGYHLVTWGKKKYIVNASGVIQKNRSVKIGAKRYVLAKKDGAVLKGKKIVSVGKNKYYVDKKGFAAVNKMVTVKKAKFYFGKNGVMVKKQLKKIKGKQYYFGKNGKMLKDKKFTYKKKAYKANSKGICKRVIK